ncbi:mandelate racemase/muconate lactonizing enzyme family protein [Mycolicibacterium vanbaalenii]|uniref:mandelate racemase/muconate lactonizing enzyme family protein n=1 Tax=Mycolicibacterium vanbaalenii TaxID=110539 RepID=UPI0013306684|nr:enolase C-terminal domain-like protein [Mycolicibacterium vanbaalenii]
MGPEVERFRYTSHSDEVYTTTTLLRITDSDGLTGVGAYDSDTFGMWDRGPFETLRPLLPRLMGLEAEDRDGVYTLVSEDNTSAFPPAVRSTIDTALWDLASRRRGVPLREMLAGGPTPTSLPGYASVPLLGDETEYREALSGFVESGYAAVKLHAWGIPERDAALMRALRPAFPALTLMFDAEGRYDRDGARIVATACADVDARWFEAPITDFDVLGYRALRDEFPAVPILPAGDALWHPDLLSTVLLLEPFSAVRFDVSFVGGPTPALRMIRVAEDAGLDVELISYGHTVIQAADLQVALAFGRTTYFEQAVPVEPFECGVTDVLRTGSDGLVHAPDGPGLGIALDEAVLETNAFERLILD